ncbi:RagB/SusD family nutrient uptake outer membrane protein [Pedobacter hiemivivus]|uniref:RagB/SusD family nutrient uptake outer membrane protein n=1 Tax=Pedobacter hiemivivus TaxID=2530454 RepID=A0A4U1GPW5_9SPHI|nr:RagB/SusD family nutrient uptake outer membrane protein [Pedobacter hiemivivus]TKC65180.1 RagB/SusD family nutrient uptake outer membrane protein [Pedobacter hiemivivus]
MKKMIIPIAAAFLLLLGSMMTSSCNKDFLEKPFSVTFNEDSIFVKYENTVKLVNDMYNLGPYYLQLAVGVTSTTRLGGSMLEAATDFGGSFRANANYGAHKFNFGTVDAEWLTNSKTGEDIYSNHYKTIRKAFTLLERVEEVPDASEAQKARIKAEAQTMIAFQYFELMKRYGGVPLVTKRLNVQTDDVNLPRSPLIDVYNYIIQMLDAAIANPDFAARYDGLDFGHLNKAFAYSLKAKAALYIASPLFNTATPYMNFGSHNNLICLTNYDPVRWETAVKFADDAIKYCESNSYAMVNTPNVNLNYTISYQYKPNQGNTEMIWATQLVTNPSMAYWIPRGTPFSGGFSSNLVSMNMVEKYQNKDGSYGNWNGVVTTPPNDPTAPYKNLDPRFNQTVMYNMQTLYGTTQIQYYEHETPTLAGNNSPSKAQTQWSHQVRKHVYGYEDRVSTQKTWSPICSQMRLTDLYMMYAEALNETLSVPDSRVYDKINLIRNRSGMPNIPTGLLKDEMRTKIQDEWAIEFAFEEYRFWDLKRWKMGNVFKGPVYDMAVKKMNNNTYTYTKYKFEDRQFYDWYYLHPFPPTEVSLQYGLVQNPGW